MRARTPKPKPAGPSRSETHDIGRHALLTPCDSARSTGCRADRHRARAPTDNPVREVRPAPAARPAARPLCRRGRRSRPVDAGRPGRRVHDGSEAAARSNRGPCHGGATASRRRHPGAGAGQGHDRHGARLGPCSRRQAVRRAGPAGRAVPLLARPLRRPAGRASAKLRRHPPGRPLRRVQSPPCGREIAGALGRIAGTPQSRLDELLPWNWTPERQHDLAA